MEIEVKSHVATKGKVIFAVVFSYCFNVSYKEIGKIYDYVWCKTTYYSRRNTQHNNVQPVPGMILE